MRGFPPIAGGARRQTAVVERTLPFPGDVLVGHGKRVQPSTIVVRGEVQERPFAWYVPDLAATEDKEPGARLAKEVGDNLVIGENIAVRKGFLGREKGDCPSPVDGILVGADLDRGHVLIAARARSVEVAAGVEGTVIDVITGRGVLIATPGLCCQGVAMTGADTGGRLRVGSAAPDAALTLPAMAEDAVVLVGYLDEAGLDAAAKSRVRALVAGTATLGAWRGLVQGAWPGLSTLLIGGIGAHGFDDRSFEQLVSADGSAALLSQRRGPFGPLARPELVVTLAGSTTAELDSPRLEPGAWVRVVAGPDCGATGTVSALPSHPIRLGRLRSAFVAEVLLVDGRSATVPIAGLELLG